MGKYKILPYLDYKALKIWQYFFLFLSFYYKSFVKLHVGTKIVTWMKKEIIYGKL